MKQFYRKLSSSRWWLSGWYLAILAGGAAAYPFVRGIMIDQRVWFRAIQSNVTLNFILFLFFYGVLSEKMTKRMKRWQSWLVWGVGMVLIVLFFRFIGGWKTVLG
ncbi:MAG: hypothetical protein JRN35_06130 [Nitrososphaerota archaeon]|nr:hypothetical protein [Nitrososphaerota archaeon]